ncbi:predicted protein [Chaetoceros tenuissimus]|uniref:Uncharacterized protein n=1 Tax=Chaetoceros tenuissimus TaxID=426638 RepID=A0AAD3CGD8_9STRA|nr:predicted protein [Chaetoceros tenuissimus]
MSKNGTAKNSHTFNAAFRQEFFPLAPIYESVYTFPTSELACTRTTSKIASPKAKTNRTAKLPYEEMKVTSNGSATSLLQEKQSSGKKKALDKQLLVEHANFFQRLSEKQNRETKAALEIQRYLRGFVVRQTLNPKQFERQSKKISKDEIWAVLLHATSRIGFEITEDLFHGLKTPVQLMNLDSNGDM